MVARGDLGVELKLGELPAVQKEVIDRANRAGVPVITATEMLESMVTSNRPTRAETSDVANAIWDGTDAVMLSQESSVGAHPVEALRAMARICLSTQRHPDYGRERQMWREPGEVGSAIAHAAATTADELGARVIIAFTESGTTALRCSKARPRVPVVAASPHPDVLRKTALYAGAIPLLVSPGRVTDQMVANATEAAARWWESAPKEGVVEVAGSWRGAKPVIGSTEGRLSEPMSRAGESLFEALDKRSDDKVATAWQALSALVLREHLSPLKFGAHYAPFITLIPVAGFDALDPTTMRFLTAGQALTKRKCKLLAGRWRLDAESARALLQVVAMTRYLKPDEAAALIGLRTIPTQLTGDLGWAAAKTVVHGGRVLGASAELSREQIAVLCAPLGAARPLASIEERVPKPVRARVRAAVDRATAAITKPPIPAATAGTTSPPSKRLTPRAPGPYRPNNAEVATFIKGVVELTPIQWLRVLDRRQLVATVTRQTGAEPAGVVRSLLAAIKGTKELDTFTRCRTFAAVQRAAVTVAAKAGPTYDESMRGYRAFREIVQLDYVDVDAFPKLVAALNTADSANIAESIPPLTQP